MSHEPYENQLLGAFLFQLGHLTPKNQTAAINLFQQTPLDRPYGDLVIGMQRCFVLEFKRNIRQISTEANKWAAKGLHTLSRPGARRTQSAMGHLLVYGVTTEAGVEMRACRYPDVLAPGPPYKGVSVDKIMQYLVSGKFSQDSGPKASAPAAAAVLGLPAGDMANYLAWMREARKKSEGSDGTEAWLGVATSGTGLRYLAADSLESLLGIDRRAERHRHHERPSRESGEHSR